MNHTPNELYSVPWSGRDVVKSIGLAVLLTLALVLIALIFSGLFRDKSALAISLTLITEGVLVLVTWVFTTRKYRCGWDALGFRPVTQKHLPLVGLALVLALSVVYVYFAVAAALGLEWLLPIAFPKELTESIYNWIFISGIVAFVAPVAEEVFFRGFVFGGIYSRFGFGWSAAISSVLFALGHLQLGMILPAFALGWLLAWLYTRTRSLWSPILVHIGYNVLALIASYSVFFQGA